MTDSNTIPKRVSDWLRQNSGSYCDDCIAEQLNLPRRQQAQRATDALSQTNEFTRSQGVCSLCRSDKLVIEAVVDPETAFAREKVRVGDDAYIDVEYRWSVDGDRVNIFIRYAEGHMDTISFWPTDPMIDDSRALDLVHMCAALDYRVRQCSSDYVGNN